MEFLFNELKSKRKPEKRIFWICKDYSFLSGELRNPFDQQCYEALNIMPGHYEGFFYYGSQKIPESISLKNYSFDTGRTELVGYGENDQYGCFTIMGSMDIAFSKGEEQMIFFGLLNPHLDEAEEEVVEEDGSHEEQEMR